MKAEIALNAVSGIAALVAAGLWLKASIIPTPAKFTYLSFFVSDDGKDGHIESEVTDLMKSVAIQSKWNAWAARSAAVAAICQVAAIFAAH